MRRIVVLAIFLALCAPLSACGSSGKSPHTLRGRIIAAALAQKSVHTTWTVPDGTIFRGDVNADSGRERATIPAGDVVEIRLVNDTVYFHSGYEGCLFLDLTAAQAERCRDRWIAIPRGHRPYRVLADSLTFGWIVRHAVPRGRVEKSFTRKPHGTSLLVLSPPTGAGLTPDPPFAYSLKARASGEPLPVASYYLLGGMAKHESYSSRIFSKWSEPVNVQAPANPTPISTVRG